MEKTEMKGGIAKLQEESKNMYNNPKVLNEIIQNMSEKIDELQAKANISDEAIEAFQEIIRNQCDEISALKEKAAAYDRLMGGSVQGMKEWANILGKPVALDDIGRGWWFTSIPKIINGEWDAPVKALIPDLYIGGGISDWQYSITLPDGWEGK